MAETGYRLLIVHRHAKTEQEAASDRVRRLTDRGRRDASAAGRWLRDNDLVPDLILTSPAARATATAELVATALGEGAPEIEVLEELYGADVCDVIEIVVALAADRHRVLVVGHNPTMSQLAHDLQTEPAEGGAGQLPTAGIAVLAIDGSWADVRPRTAALLHWHVPRA